MGNSKLKRYRGKEEFKNCYFCNYNYDIYLHHIIQKQHRGENDINNLLPLCCKCHRLVHSKIGYMIFSNGFYYYVRDGTEEIIKKPYSLMFKKDYPINSVYKALLTKKLFCYKLPVTEHIFIDLKNI